MDVRDSARQALAVVLPVPAAALALFAAGAWLRPPSGAAEGPWWAWWLLLVTGSLAALHPPLDRRTFGSGALVLPAALIFLGPVPAGLLAGIGFLVRESMWRLFFRRPTDVDGWWGLALGIGRSGRLVLALLIAGLVWRGDPGWAATGTDPQLFSVWSAGALAAYLLALLSLDLVERRWIESSRGAIGRLGVAALFDLGGWALGLVVALVVRALGWGPAAAILIAIAFFAVELARSVHGRRLAVEQVGELWEVTRAGHRIIHRSPDLAGIAEQVLAECRKVLPVSWFQFDLVDGRAAANSWSAGPDGRVQIGPARPADAPPALPGIHRRASWKVLERSLEGDGQVIARLWLWCDPRRLESTSVELLDSLLPHVAASVHRALLDRRAKQDPLTGLADRRVLEARLGDVFLSTREEGGSMAVIMCDLDSFKVINDRFGHDVGDRALVEVAAVLEACRRESDICCRYGGEEFAVILEKTDGETAQRVADRLRLAVQGCEFSSGGQRVPLRMSAGVAAFPELHVKSGKELLLLADEALLEAKRRGRNRCYLHLGRGRFRTTAGRTVEVGRGSEPAQAPKLFA